MLKQLPTRLPKYLHCYFWDVGASKINPSKNSPYILERLMDRGDLRAIKWIFKYFSKRDLKKVFQQSRNISKFSRPLWAVYLKTNSIKEVCLQQEFLQSPGTAWPY